MKSRIIIVLLVFISSLLSAQSKVSRAQPSDTITVITDSLLSEPEEFNAFETKFVLPKPIGGIRGIESQIIITEASKKERMSGIVNVLLTVDENGDVVYARVLNRMSSSLTESVLFAIRSTKFIPGTLNGRPTKMDYKLSIRVRQ
jgi:TonB family protein